MKKYKIIIILILLLLVLVVILQNTGPVVTNFLFFEFSLPRALLLFLTFAFGFIAGLLVAMRFEGKTEKKHDTASGPGK
jgi:putative membrane protein